MRRPTLRMLCTAALLAGCGQHEPSPAPKPAATSAPVTPAPAKPAPATPTTVAPPAASSAPAPTAAASVAAPADAFRLTGLALGRAIDAGYAVREPGSSFPATTHTLYASVASTGRAAKATLGVRWRYLEGEGSVVNELSQDLASDGPAHTAFKVNNPDRWPTGKYRVEITLDGKPALAQNFEITAR